MSVSHLMDEQHQRHSDIEKQQECLSLLSLLVNIVLGILDNTIKHEKECRGKKLG